MNVITRGIKNAFRNIMRTIAIVVIIGLTVGLALTMLIAHQAVAQKIASVKSSIGNTITISPAGFSGFSDVNNALSTSQLNQVKNLAHVTGVTESLMGRLTTNGSQQPQFGFGDQNQNSNATTSLTSPVTINFNGQGGGRFFNSGGFGGQIPTNFTPPVTILGTTDPTTYESATITISSGSMINGTVDSNDALISQAMASKNNLSVGSTFQAYGTNLTVKGIFTSSTKAGDGTIVVSLPALQRLSGQSGDVTSAIATVDSLDNLSSATSAIKTTLGSSADVTNSQDQANQAIQPLNSIESISLFSVIGAVIAGGVILLLTMVMIVRERRREIGVFKAIGASNLRIMFQFMTEAVTFTVIGLVIGLALGVLGGNPVTKLLVDNTGTSASQTGAPGGPVTIGGGGGRFGGGSGLRQFATGSAAGPLGIRNIHAAVSWSILLYGFLAAIVIALLGSAIASFLISKVRPAEVMRVE